MEDKNNLEFSFTQGAPDKCPCGSGKKPKRCCGPVKPRNHSIQLDGINYKFAEGLIFDLSDMTVKRLLNGKRIPIVGKSTFVQSYDRPKGPKALVEAQLNNIHSMDPNGVFLEYDHFFAIDTNTKVVDGKTIAISAIMHAYTETEKNGRHTVKYAPVTFLEFRNPEVQPEHLGWMALCMAAETDNGLTGKNVAVVVDSSKASLSAINSGKLPVCGEYYLPPNFTLVYASADSGGSILNKLIKRCDRQAGNLLAWIVEEDFQEGLQTTKSYPCEQFRQLEPNGNDPSWKIAQDKRKRA